MALLGKIVCGSITSFAVGNLTFRWIDLSKMTPDLINGLFELLGAAFVGLTCRRILIDRQCKGVSVWQAAYFTSWGFWNLFFYPHVGQWLSFWGGIAVVLVNTTWLGLMVRYRHVG